MIEHSVLLHSHDHAPFIRGCLDSLLTQTLPPEEIVVYDAGSTDGTRERLRDYGDRIRLLEGPRHAGPPFAAETHALQAAFAASRGEIVFLLEGCDRFKPEKVERYVDAFKRHPDASVVQAPLDRIDAAGKYAGIVLEPRYHVRNHLREIYRRHDLDLFYPTSALAFSRHYLERILPLDLSDGLPLWPDARLCIPSAYYGRIVTLPDPLTDWRAHAQASRPHASPSRRLIAQTFMRARVFNAFCRRHRLRTIHPWRSGRLYLRVARLALPDWIADVYFRRIRPWLDAV